MAIGLVQTTDRTVNQLQQNIKQAVEPVLNNPLVNGQVLFNLNLKLGTNVINHGLGRSLQGWVIVGQGSAASFYDQQAKNSTKNLTLLLVASADVTINLYVF
jgi:hypothetical protein